MRLLRCVAAPAPTHPSRAELRAHPTTRSAVRQWCGCNLVL